MACARGFAYDQYKIYRSLSFAERRRKTYECGAERDRTADLLVANEEAFADSLGASSGGVQKASSAPSDKQRKSGCLLRAIVFPILE